MSRNPTAPERADALIAQARALPGFRKRHCTLGAVAATTGAGGGRFPTPAQGGLLLWRLNYMLSPGRALQYARRIMHAHDRGRSEESWEALHEALSYGLASGAARSAPSVTYLRRSEEPADVDIAV